MQTNSIGPENGINTHLRIKIDEYSHNPLINKYSLTILISSDIYVIITIVSC